MGTNMNLSKKQLEVLNLNLQCTYCGDALNLDDVKFAIELSYKPNHLIICCNRNICADIHKTRGI